jgi:hypothetical protein
MGNIADEVGFLAGQGELTLKIRHDQPTADRDGEHEQSQQQPEGQPGRVGRPLGLQGIEQIGRHLPMREHFADLGGDEGMFPGIAARGGHEAGQR